MVAEGTQVKIVDFGAALLTNPQVTQIKDVGEHSITITRQVKPYNTEQGSQQPYVIARGKNMGGREIAQARAQQEEFNAYIRQTAAGGRTSSVDELARLSEIRSRGDITEEEFRRAKDLVLTGHSPAGHSGATSRPPGR